MISKKSLDFAAIRARLANARGKTFWRSLEELAETKEFREFLHDEFPRQVMLLSEPIDRRQALKLLGASLALAGLAGCNSNQRDLEEIVPYVEAPERIVPGKPLFFATTMALGGVGLGLLAESHMGRPIKVEGNPDHPGSLGFTDVFAQGSVLTLYDPDRSQAVTNQGRIRTWDNFLAEFRSALDAQRGAGGAGVRILTETVTSPTLAAQIQEILGLFPEARWHQYEPISADNAAAGARLAFGEDVHTVYRFDQANVVLSLDADFLACFPANVRYVHDFSNRRRVTTEGETAMSRLYAVESTHTNTGAKADHRLRVRSSDVEAVARAVAGRLGVAGLPASSVPETVRADVIDLLVRDLDANRGASIVIAGQNQPPIVHALAHAINDVLGNAGTTVTHTEPLQANPVDQIASLGELVADMAGGRVEVLVIIGGNPVYTAPADLSFAQALENVGLRVHLSLYEDETSALCHWHIPEAHFLEAWGDARAFDGTVSIVQPLIAPLYGGRSAHEMLATFSDNPSRTGLEIVRAFWQTQYQPTLETPFQGDFERFWRRILHDGVIPNTALPAREVTLRTDELGAAGTPGAAEGAGLEIVFRPDPTIFDGRFANNAWLQELPKPITKLVWDNAAMVSPATAQQLGVAEEQLVELRLGGRTVRAPIWIMPGHADNSVTVHLGYGRRQAGGIGSGTGFDAYALRTSGAPWISTGLEIAPTGEQYSLVTTQPHHSMEGRHIVRAGTQEEYRENPGFAQEQEHGIEAAHPDEHGQEGVTEEPPASLYPEWQYEGYRWGMAIDLTTCTGCSACVIACQAENNIPVVGKAEVARSREMHWLRVDSYFAGGTIDEPEATYFMPVPCMHCEKAPCEPVCPVAATVHSSEGLNEMIYNRCVGTRYCSNNCPYKVRRFNFLNYYEGESAPVLQLLRNPDVTVRSRGVMEKCTYCVQRIWHGRIEAEKEGRRIRDGEVVTACAAACPAQAIVFGDINDPESRVARLKEQPLNYALLAELGTQPRTTYLAAVRNPNSVEG